MRYKTIRDEEFLKNIDHEAIDKAADMLIKIFGDMDADFKKAGIKNGFYEMGLKGKKLLNEEVKEKNE